MKNVDMNGKAISLRYIDNFVGKNNCSIINHMSIKYYITKMTSRCLYNVSAYKNGKELAKYNFIIDNKTAIINNIHIHESYRGHGYGTSILNDIETYAKKVYDVNRVSMLAWQPSDGNDVRDFYYKNGYIEQKSVGIYDDYVTVYDLYPFVKCVK